MRFGSDEIYIWVNRQTGGSIAHYPVFPNPTVHYPVFLNPTVHYPAFIPR